MSGRSGQTTPQLNAPFQNPALELPAEIDVTDPTHPLFGRRFRVLSVATPLSSAGSVIVNYGKEMHLRIPWAATSLASPGQTPAVKLTVASVTELVTLANDYELLCLSPRKASGGGCRRPSGRPSSKNSLPSSRR